MQREELGRLVKEAFWSIDTGHAIKPGVWSKDVMIEPVPENYRNVLVELFDEQIKDYQRCFEKERVSICETVKDANLSMIVGFLESNGMCLYDDFKQDDVQTVFLVYYSRPSSTQRKNEYDTAFDRITHVPRGITFRLIGDGLILDERCKMQALDYDTEHQEKNSATLSMPELDKCRITYNALAKMFLQCGKKLSVPFFSGQKKQEKELNVISASAVNFLIGRALYWADSIGYLAYSFQEKPF